MKTAAVLLWAGCLWSIVRAVLSLVLTASPGRRLLVLAVLVLAASSAHKPHKKASLSEGGGTAQP